MDHTTDAVARARAYLAALQDGVTGDDLARFFTEDVVQNEFPNAFVPRGAERDLAGILEAAVRGGTVLSSQRFDVLSAMASGDHVAMEVQWAGVLAVAIGSLSPGSEMTARFAVFLDYRDGKIARQRNYDCFDPFQ